LQGQRAGIEKVLFKLIDFDSVVTPEVSSLAFAADAALPSRYTADGESISSPLRWRPYRKPTLVFIFRGCGCAANASGENMPSVHVTQIREAVAAAQRFAQKSTLDGCDLSDVDEIILPLTHELERPNPNTQTLATYLNSLLRSLRAQPHAEEICSQLDEVMKQSGIPTDWQP
jgi:hypothetical protein